MKKIMLMATAAILFSACGSNTANKTNTDTTAKKTATMQYTCTMHPEVLSNKPGKCPKCGMTLVEKTDNK
ncbi:heavy metal-binding domain-containing protein [Mucilaginibacter segetis]|uniref:Heavy metal binding domain-containing protein n=1 Tax=Mucilaginibacter segetis TaxID=2793071 RepID=A0A934PUB8_9SPHI|nr:heavy metal-binding domain-containing protein [Mucilaginibacter segetis]MBK0379235.1 hypothetical protein [Mucilaginibacter segetis]